MIEEYKDQKEIQMIVFQLDKGEYAVPITSVQEIIMPQTPTKIPKSPSFVEGVINLRGHVIPVIDGRKKFQLEISEKSNETRIMILDVEHDIVGLIVDSVSEVIHLNTEDIEPTPIDIEDGNDFIHGVGKFQNRLLILLNLSKFLHANETQSLKNLTKVVESMNSVKNTELEKLKQNI